MWLARAATLRWGRRLVGCGCTLLLGTLALPIVVIAALSQAGNPAGEPNAGGFEPWIVLATGEPLPPGTFTVSQGFGCTSVGGEPAAPADGSCTRQDGWSARSFHTGIDLAAGSGTVASAVAAGMVRIVSTDSGFGVHILLTPLVNDGHATVYLYGHLSGAAVPDGARVRAGEPIGFVGSTGNSTGPHLHFEADVDGVPVNPCPVFPAGYLPPAVAAHGCLEAPP